MEKLREKSINCTDLYPDKAQYRPGEKGSLLLNIECEREQEVHLEAVFQNLHHPIWTEKSKEALNKGFNRLTIPFQAPHESWACFGVKIEIYGEGGFLSKHYTGFDVADHWRRSPRYGFLSDFKTEELGSLADVEALNKYHINVVQFYDWMYRHDDLVPPETEFTDPMGRTLNYAVVKEKITALHEKNMAAMAYGAVYAALKDFYGQHREWGLYGKDGKRLHLIDIFNIMDISPDSPWVSHIVSEFEKVIREGFDGIHMDQYGFPKKAYRNVNGHYELVDLAVCYPALIDRTKSALSNINPDTGLIFNNVSNYPVHTTATADQEAVYIEVWPPVVHLRELKGLVDRGRELSGNKHVILSAYLPTFKDEGNFDPIPAENGALITMATIFASGGFHLLLGEAHNVLTEAYYPSYGKMRPVFQKEVRSYYDFIVCYGQLLHDFGLEDLSMTYTGGVNTELTFKGGVPFSPNGDIGSVWTIVKQLPDFMVIHLVNLVGLEDDYWEHVKVQRPETQQAIECTVLLDKELEGIYMASPDAESIEPVKLPYEIVEHEHGEAARFVIPNLSIWDMIYMEWRS